MRAVQTSTDVLLDVSVVSGDHSLEPLARLVWINAYLEDSGIHGGAFTESGAPWNLSLLSRRNGVSRQAIVRAMQGLIADGYATKHLIAIVGGQETRYQFKMPEEV